MRHILIQILILLFSSNFAIGQNSVDNNLLFKLYNNFPLNSSLDSVINYCRINNYESPIKNYEDSQKIRYEKEILDKSFFKLKPSKISNYCFYSHEWNTWDTTTLENLVMTLNIRFSDSSKATDVIDEFWSLIDRFKKQYGNPICNYFSGRFDESGQSFIFHIDKYSSVPELDITLTIFMKKYLTILVSYARPYK